MKALTIIATVFMPPAFISDIYYMNFRYVFERRYGYFATLPLMALIGTSIYP